MGMTLWIHTLVGREMSKESDDHSLMQKYSPALDKLCKQLQVPTLSSFVDTTDAEYSLSEDDEDGEPKLDPETGLGYGIDDMKWFDSHRGISTLTALRQHIEKNGLPRLGNEDKRNLLEELDDCLRKLESAKTGKFHLALVE